MAHHTTPGAGKRHILIGQISPEQWAAALEQRALLAGLPAVINGIECPPSSQEADDALTRLYGPHIAEGAAA